MPASSSDTRNKWKKPRGVQRRKPRPQSNHLDDEEEDDDYEDDDEDVDLDRRPPQPHFNRGSINSTAASGAEVSDAGTRVSAFPSVIKHTVNQHHQMVTQIVAMERANRAGDTSGAAKNGPFLENISYGQLQAVSAHPRDSPALTSGDAEGSFVITPPPIVEGRGVFKRYGSDRVHVVPMHADWFSPATINRLERQAVPHFFSGKSSDHTPEKYMDCRNRIVAKYLENPARRLSASDCHAFLAGVDADDINRVVRFLENWGVINYCATTPNHNDPIRKDSCLTEDSKGELCVPATALQSIDSLIQFDRPKCKLKMSDIYPESETHSDDEHSDIDSRIREQLSENRCNNCSRPLAGVYYQSIKEIDVLLCLACFNEGAFVVGHSSLDFIKVDSTKGYGDFEGDNWTNQETLLLLEAIELYNENWVEVAAHVGTKSKDQCILRFVRLPIDETPLENIEVPIPSSSSDGDGCGRQQPRTNGKGSIIEDPDFECRLPFEKSGNPVMSQVAFLASAVGPRVAAACAHASLAVLAEDQHVDDSEGAGVVDKSDSDNRMNSENTNRRDNSPRVGSRNSAQQRGENSRAENVGGQGDASDASITPDKVKKAVRAGLAAAATKAKLFADHEEREIQRLSANIINHQLKRLELKLKQFAEVETYLMKECEQVERQRQRTIAERALILSPQFGAGGATRPPSLPGTGTGPSMLNNSAAGSSRLQVPGSSSQPFISGYPNSQAMHPQQAMYGLGPRLPLSAINPSSPSLLRPQGRSGFE